MFLQYIVDVLSLGSLYALFALGLVLVYGILKLVNFAYGELVLVIGYSIFLLKGSPFPWFFMAGIKSIPRDSNFKFPARSLTRIV